MINGRRSDIDILTDILKLSCESAKKTRILYQANLSHKQLERYIDVLMGNGLLIKKMTPFRVYQTSEKGHEFIALSQKINTFFE